jgi:hypothetical protein
LDGCDAHFWLALSPYEANLLKRFESESLEKFPLLNLLLAWNTPTRLQWDLLVVSKTVK